jgi:hypothetical protein
LNIHIVVFVETVRICVEKKEKILFQNLINN